MKKRYIFSAKKYNEWCIQTGIGQNESSWQYYCDGCEIDPITSTVVGKNSLPYACSINDGELFPWYEVQEITEVGDVNDNSKEIEK